MAPASPLDQRGIRLTILLIVLLGSWHARAVSAQIADPRPPAAGDDPFARRAWHLEFGGQAQLEAWNYNTSHEELYGVAPGFTYGLGRGVALTVAWPITYVSQRGIDALVLGATVGMRGRIYRWRGVSLFWDWGLGASQADTYIPPRGTRFNYVAQGGGGATIRLGRGLHALAAVRWMHLSNYGLAGRDRNPDIEAVGGHVGVLVPF